VTSIRRRLTVWVLAGCSVLWAGGAAGLYFELRSGLLGEFDATLAAKAQALAALTRQRGAIIELDFPGELMPSFERASAAEYFQLQRADGGVVDRSPSLEGHVLAGTATPAESPQYADVTLPDGSSGRAITLRFLPQSGEDEAADSDRANATATAVTVIVALHRSALDHRLNALATTLLAAWGLLALVTLVGVPALVRRGLSPLDAVAQQARGIDSASLERRFPSTNLPAELAPICARLNELLARLQASFERERRFTADVSHELRTPVAELRAIVDVALRSPGDVAEATLALQEAREVAAQMNGLITRLLTLARCEAGLQSPTHEPVHVASMLREVWEPLAVQAARKHLVTSWNLSDDTCLETDRTSLRAIFSNLAANAVEYCPDAGSIEIYVADGHDSWQFEISNTVAQLTTDDVSHLFDRFWQRDPRRAAPSHSGLGLSVSKALATSAGMDLTAQMRSASVLSLVLTMRHERN
jgi:two-component system sensor histidine kinase QseC